MEHETAKPWSHPSNAVSAQVAPEKSKCVGPESIPQGVGRQTGDH